MLDWQQRLSGNYINGNISEQRVATVLRDVGVLVLGKLWSSHTATLPETLAFVRARDLPSL